MKNIIIVIGLFLGTFSLGQESWKFNTVENVNTSNIISVDGELISYPNGDLKVCINSDCIMLTKISGETTYFEGNVVYNVTYKDVDGVYIYTKFVTHIESVLMDAPSLGYKFWYYNE